MYHFASSKNNDANVLELEVSGKFVASDFHGLEATFQRLVKPHRKIRVLLRMLDFHGWEGLALSAKVKFDLRHFREIERHALVGDRQWEKFLGAFAHPITAADMRYFSKGALAEALA